MTLGVLLPPAAATRSAEIAAHAVAHARLLDEAGADYVIVSRSNAGTLSPVSLAAHLAAQTHRIGIVAEARADLAEPLLLSSALATLDHVSSGRAGWLVEVADASPAAFSDAIAVADAVVALWDSWDDDAVVRDLATWRYLDSARLHAVDAEGPGFRIAGPSITPRPPQGHPVVMTRGVSSAIAGSADWVDLMIGAEEGAGRAVPELRVRSEADASHVVTLATDTDVLAVPETAEALETIVSTLHAVTPRRADATPSHIRSLRDALGLARPASRFARAE